MPVTELRVQSLPFTARLPPGAQTGHFLQVATMGVAGSKAKCYVYLMYLNIFESFAKSFSPSPFFKHVVFRKICPSGSDSFALNASEGGVVIPD